MITYYGFLSLFPLLLLLVTILGFVLQHDAGLQARVVDSTLAQLAFVQRVRVITPGGGIAPVVGSSEPGDDFQADTDYDAVWNFFYLTGPRRQRAGPRLPITYISSRRARVRVSVIHSRRTVARGSGACPATERSARNPGTVQPRALHRSARGASGG